MFLNYTESVVKRITHKEKILFVNTRIFVAETYSERRVIKAPANYTALFISMGYIFQICLFTAYLPAQVTAI